MTGFNLSYDSTGKNTALVDGILATRCYLENVLATSLTTLRPITTVV